MSDPYVYPGSWVLKNKLDIRDADDLETAEKQIVSLNRLALPTHIPPTLDGFQAIHRHLFQDIYDWAGEFRKINISKVNDDGSQTTFCTFPFVAVFMKRQFQVLAADNNMQGLSQQDFAKRAAQHTIEINTIHPFREGNGRTVRQYLKILARQAGHDLDLTRIYRKGWMQASIIGHAQGDAAPMTNIILNAIHAHNP